MTYDQTSYDRDLIGRTLQGRFEILWQIGGGGMGSVFVARQLSVDRNVAVKVLRPGHPGTAVKRFLREARAVSGMSHPGIVQVIDHGESDGIIFIAMEFVDGVPLQDLLHKGRIHPHFALEVVDQVCAALNEAHRHGVIHRDLKPANIVMTRDTDGLPRAKLLDFGIAFSAHDPRLTQSGTLCGTPAYMAPEQAQAREIVPQTDLYSLGIVLYQMLSGHLPFHSETPLGVLLKHLKSKAPPLDRHVRTGVLPEPLVSLAAWMMKKQIENRPATPRQVQEAIAEMRDRVALGSLRQAETDEIAFDEWVLPRLTKDAARDADTSPNVLFRLPNTEKLPPIDTLAARDTTEPVDAPNLPNPSVLEELAATEELEADPEDNFSVARERAKSAPDEAAARAWAAFAEASESGPERQSPQQIDPNLWDFEAENRAAFSESSIEFDVPARFFTIEPKDTGTRSSLNRDDLDLGINSAADVTAGMVPTAAKESIEQKNSPELAADSPPPAYELERIERPKPRALPEREKQPELGRRHTLSSFLLSNIIFIALLIGLVASMAFIGMEVFVNEPKRTAVERRSQPEEQHQYAEEDDDEEEEVAAEPQQDRKETPAQSGTKKTPASKEGKALDELPWRDPIELYKDRKLEKEAERGLDALNHD